METIFKKRIKYLTPIQQNIVEYLSMQGSKRRTDLECDLNIPHTTAYDNLKKLMDKKIVWKKSIQTGKIGRPCVYWQIKQAHNLVLSVLSELPELLDEPEKKKKKTTLKHGKLPKIERKIMINEVKHLTYILKKLEDLKLKKLSNNEPTTSYILTNKNSKLTKFVLNEINKYTYFRTATLSNNYVNEILKTKYTDTREEIRRSTSNRIGRIIRELNDLKIIVKYTKSTRSVWKNLYKGNLYKILDKRMEKKYFIFKVNSNNKKR